MINFFLPLALHVAGNSAILIESAGQEEIDHQQAVASPAEAEVENANTGMPAPVPRPIGYVELQKAGGKAPLITFVPKERAPLKELQARGIQGEPRIAFIVGIDGTIRDIRIKETTGSDELDAFAVTLVSGMKVEPGQNASGEAVEVLKEIPLNFWKDSLVNGSLQAKTCADYVIDADWFMATFPDKELRNMRVTTMSLGVLVALGLRDFPKKVPKEHKAYQTCKRKPEANFFEVYRKSY